MCDAWFAAFSSGPRGLSAHRICITGHSHSGATSLRQASHSARPRSPALASHSRLRARSRFPRPYAHWSGAPGVTGRRLLGKKNYRRRQKKRRGGRSRRGVAGAHQAVEFDICVDGDRHLAQKLQSITFVITSAHHGTTQKRQRENRAAATDSQHKGQVGGGRIVSEALKVLAHRLCFVSSGAGLVSSYTAKALLLNTVCGPPRRSDGACSLEHRFILMSTSICDGVTSALVSITSPRPAVCWVCVGGGYA